MPQWPHTVLCCYLLQEIRNVSKHFDQGNRLFAKLKQPSYYYLIFTVKSSHLKNTYFSLMLSNINENIVLKYLYIFLMHTDIYSTVIKKDSIVYHLKGF